MNANATGRKRGRPRKHRPEGSADGPRGGKGAALTTVISVQMRDALDAEAERTGRSISQVAEAWMEQGQALQALGPASTEVSREIGHMLRFAAALAEVEGDPMQSTAAHEMLCLGWAVIAHRALPQFNDEAVRYGTATMVAAGLALQGLPDTVIGDPRFTDLRELLGAVAEGRVGYDDASWARLSEIGKVVMDEWETSDALTTDEGQDRAILHLWNLPRLNRRASHARDVVQQGIEAIPNALPLLLAGIGAIAPDEISGLAATIGAQTFLGSKIAEMDLARRQSKLKRNA